MIPLRTVLIVGLLVLGVVFHTKFDLSQAWYFYLTAFVLLITQFLFGNIWQAFSYLNKGKPEEAGKIIGRIHYPNLLIKRNRAYYHFIKGMLYLQHKDLNPANENLGKSLHLGLREGTDTALALLNLAHIHYMQKNKDLAKSYLQKAKAIQSNDLMIKEHLQKLEGALG